MIFGEKIELKVYVNQHDFVSFVFSSIINEFHKIFILSIYTYAIFKCTLQYMSILDISNKRVKDK